LSAWRTGLICWSTFSEGAGGREAHAAVAAQHVGRHVALGCLLDRHAPRRRRRNASSRAMGARGAILPTIPSSVLSGEGNIRRGVNTDALLDGLDRVGWTQVSGIIRAKLGSFGKKAQLILNCIFDLYNLKREGVVPLRALLQADPAARATRPARCTAAPCRALAGRGTNGRLARRPRAQRTWQRWLPVPTRIRMSGAVTGSAISSGACSKCLETLRKGHS
jgi:hypothetical protein